MNFNRLTPIIKTTIAGIILLLQTCAAPQKDEITIAEPDLWLMATETKLIENESLVALGKEIYEKVCYLCHGDEAKGDGKVAEFMVTKPRDLTSGKFKVRTTPTGSLPSDDDLFRTITRGFPK
ncbi:MAG: hypothetical protein IIB39_11120, partial [Candidatus Marinimicrobia bacterium]|nr:hypothetical protein [Candidatus Neomarinimicrobiota bacterium]